MTRIDYLDGQRGIAILLVVFYHAYSRWSTHVPYGDQWGDIPLIKFGYMGVELFFLISGFVILMTLEKSPNPVVFLYKRWLRLFPTMLICSVIIFVTLPLLPLRPSGSRSLIDILPSLTFIDPIIMSKVLGLNITSLEGAFWSIFVEVKFYLVCAVLYFVVGTRGLVISLFLGFMSYHLLAFLTSITSHYFIELLYTLTYYLSFKYFGWFAAGAAFYLFKRDDDIRWWWGACVMCLISIGLFNGFDGQFQLNISTALLTVSLLFALSLRIQIIQAVLRSPALVWFGFISYPLYLLHENMMIALLAQGAQVIPIPVIFSPFLVILFIAMVAYVIASYGEGFLRKKIISVVASVLFRSNRI